MPDVYLKREDQRGIFFAYAPLTGLIFAAVGSVFAWIGFTVIDDTFGTLMFGGMGSLFAVIGIGATFYRHELHLDLGARRYTRRKGFWPAPRTDEGSLDEITGIWLEQEERHRSSKHGSRTYMVWVVKLPFRGEEKPTSVFESQDETQGYARAEALAKKLRVPLVDRTQLPERVTAWDQLDVSLADREAAKSTGWSVTASVSAPPSGSRIEFDQTPSRRAILLPAAGFGLVSVFLGLFGLVFAGVGGFALWAKLSGMPVKESSENAAWIVGSVFLLTGLCISMGGVVAARAQGVVREVGDEMVFAFSVFGRDWLGKRIPRREIEEVEIRYAVEPSRERGRVRAGGYSFSLGSSKPSPRMEVVVRSDRHVARLGRHLNVDEQQWLRDTLTALASYH